MGMGKRKTKDAAQDVTDQIFGPTCKIIVKKVTNLKNKVKIGTIDPYVEVTFENHTKKTKVKDDTKNPVYNEELQFPRGNSDQVKVQVKVYHEQSLSTKDKLLAYGTGTINNYMRLDWHDLEIKLIDSKQCATEGVCSIGVGGGGGEGHEEEDGAYVEEEEMGFEEDEETVGGSTGGPKSGSKKRKLNKTAKSNELSAAVEQARAKINFASLSTKEECFQVRFVIHKARQLTGFIETPLVRVIMNGKTMRTQTRHGGQPKYNETVVFSLTKSEKSLLDLPIEIAVIDSSKDQQSNLVGLYTFDLTVAWCEKDHLLLYKWFALTDPEEPQEGMTGYLNVSIQVIPPGESPQKLPKKSDTEIDVASNVFYPPGTALQPGQFIVKLFTGEDMPQMDSAVLANVRNLFQSGEKPPDLVDPYVVFEFAGGKIQSSIQYGTFDPVWDQKLVLHGEFPSMAENFVIRVIDRDDYDIDDLIATKLLKMSHISFSSSDADLGFLPTFGPTYMPLYGSLREHNDVHDKYEGLNQGNEPGIAYRGRILLELNTNMGEPDPDTKSKSNLSEQNTADVMSKLRRHKYHLFTSFDTGNMIRETDNQVEFEVSIGDYGNSLSLQGNQYPSTTQPCNAVYDGTQYYFMPWGSSKPTVILHSQWEDVDFRCESLNIMLWMEDFMEEEMRKYRIKETAGGDQVLLDQECNKVIQTIIDEMEALSLPVLPDNATKLDRQLNKLRLYHMGKLRKPKEDKPDFVGIDIENPESVAIDLNEAGGKDDSLHRIEELYDEDEEEDDDETNPLLLDMDEEVDEEQNLKDTLGINDVSQNDNVQFENFIDELQFLLTGRYKNYERENKIKNVEGVIAKFKHLCFEPQISIPDVFVWMMSGTTRIAYTRIPINDIIYTENPKGRGKLCGKTGSFFLKKPKKESIGAHLSLTVWFGKFEHVAKAFKTPKGSEVTVYAETYENNISMVGSWTTKLMPRPKFSDVTGKYEIPKESFSPPEGWRFDGDWYISFDSSLLFDNEQGLTVFRETVFEGQTRTGGSKWDQPKTETWWTDEKGDDSHPKEELVCREGWQWATDWVLDTNRAVDSEGFEYADESDYGNYGPIERNYHLARRRLWTRVRNRVGDVKKKEFEGDAEGWEYSKLFTTKFHPKERTFDLVRRRRWNRKLISKLPVPIVFSVPKDDKKKDDPELFSIAPRVMTEFGKKNVRQYQLRAYIYQARGLLGADPTGYSDPYARVIFGNRSGCTKTIHQTCSPLWDTTVILDSIEICGDKEDIVNNPPYIVIELFDEDVLSQALHNSMKIMKKNEKSRKIFEEISNSGREIPVDFALQVNNNTSHFINHDKLGRVVCKPRVMTDQSEGTKLEWLSVTGVKGSKGELLGAFELYEISEKELPLLPRCADQKYEVPSHIRPELTRTRVEILTWGLRQLRDYKMSPVDSPHIEIEVGGVTLTMDKIKSIKRHSNFDRPHNFLDVMLPKDALYLPPINIRVLDNRSFGYTPLVGVTTVKEYGQYRTSYQALLDLNEHRQTLERNAGKFTKLDDDTTESTTGRDSSDKEITTPEMVAIELHDTDVVEIGDMSIATDNSTNDSKKGKSQAMDMMNLIDNDELAITTEGERGIPLTTFYPKTDPKPKPMLEKQPTRAEIRQQKQLEAVKAANPDDVLVSDWWSKYYECIGTDPRLKKLFRDRDLPRLKMFDKELEEYYNNFNDLMESIPLYKPDNEISDDEDSSEDEDEADFRHRVGYFKGSIKIYEIDDEMYEQALKETPKLLFSNLPTNKKADVLVRVYVAGAVGLTPLDYGGSVDPYLVVKCGKITIDDKSNYIPKDVNPTFGRMFQIRAKLPRDSKLLVKVYDHDLIGANDLIGSTTIDIEDRFLSWRRASCGLTQHYIKTRGDKDRWRDQLKPIDILKRMCLLKGWVKPVFKRDKGELIIVVNDRVHTFEKKSNGPMILGEAATPEKDKTSERNRLALEVLHRLGVVPEHIETRTLTNDDCPGIPQGKLHMWVDIFPYSDSIPPPIVIAPRVPQKYVLRCIIYNTEDVILEDTNVLGEQMSDIYLKCYFEGMKKESQETDVHYRSLTGEGNFNWRMVYNFDYIVQEQKMIQKKKTKFYHIEKSVKKVDPIFHVKVYDKDVLSRDDVLGWTEFDLTRLPAPTKTAGECSLEIYEDEEKHPRMCLFDTKKIKGFWPVYDDSMGKRELTGKIEMELEVLTEEEAAERPAGKAREEPNLNPTLEPPNRPETSFNWFTNPWKVFKILIWRRYKWHLIIGVVLILVVIFVALMFYSAPGAINDAIYN